MLETFNQFTKIEKKEKEFTEKEFSQNLEDFKGLLDKNANILSKSDIERESDLEFSQLLKHQAHEDEGENDLFAVFKNNFKEIIKPKFKHLYEKFSKIPMTKASTLALIVALNLNPKSIAEQSIELDQINNNEKETSIKSENEEEKKDTYYIAEEELEKLSPLDNLLIKDSDFFSRGNQEFIEKNGIEIEQKFFEIGQEKFLINILKKEGPNTQKYFICHDNENASFDTALRAIKNGGEVIALGNNENRFLYSYGEKKGLTDQDPNRMFDENNKYWPLAEKILELLKANESERIIALHNNSPHGNFHLDNIKNWRNISILSENDENRRSLIWLPGLEKEPNDNLAKEIEFYKNNGLNVVYEHVPQNSPGDGSFSVYAALNNINYLNIETVMGNLEDQKKYLSLLKKYHQIDKSRDILADL